MGGFQIGRIFGFPIHLRFSFLFLMGVALVVWQSLNAVVMLLGVFAMVLLHELGHALVARRLKIPILGIELTIFGGVARMGGMPDRPRDEVLIAGAGPLVSLVLAAGFYGAHLLSGGLGFLLTLAQINLVLACFNMIPALPMDGGRIFRATMASRLGRLRATRVAVAVSRALSVVLMIWAVFGLWPLPRPSFMLAALAGVLWFMAGAELRAATMWGAFGQPRAPGQGSAEDGVEVLDAQGRRVGVAGGWNDPEPGFTVQEHRDAGVQRWVVRGPDGKILFVSETPLRW